MIKHYVLAFIFILFIAGCSTKSAHIIMPEDINQYSASRSNTGYLCLSGNIDTLLTVTTFPKNMNTNFSYAIELNPYPDYRITATILGMHVLERIIKTNIEFVLYEMIPGTYNFSAFRYDGPEERNKLMGSHPVKTVEFQIISNEITYIGSFEIKQGLMGVDKINTLDYEQSLLSNFQSKKKIKINKQLATIKIGFY